jgi:hypothetical protein
VSDVQTSLLSTVVVFQNVWHKLNFVHIGIADTCGQLCVFYVLGSPGETETPTHWKLIGHRMSDLPSVLLPSSIFPPPSCHCFYFSKEELGTHSKIVAIVIFLIVQVQTHKM